MSWSQVRVTISRAGNVLDRQVKRELSSRESRRLERDLARELLPLFEDWRRKNG